jgi:hypothetical protein
MIKGKKVEIYISPEVGSPKMFIDGEEIDRVMAVTVKASVGELPIVVFAIMPDEVQIKGIMSTLEEEDDIGKNE